MSMVPNAAPPRYVSAADGRTPRTSWGATSPREARPIVGERGRAFRTDAAHHPRDERVERLLARLTGDDHVGLVLACAIAGRDPCVTLVDEVARDRRRGDRAWPRAALDAVREHH